MDMYMSEAASRMLLVQAWQVEENGGALHIKHYITYIAYV